MKKISTLILFTVFCISISCRKNSDLNSVKFILKNNGSAVTPTYGTVSTKDILDFFKKTPQITPAGILLSQATEAVINGEQVIRIPVATNAALYFTKENDSLKVYAYKWIYNTQTTKYTGMIDVFSFQDQSLKRLIYAEGKIKQVLLLSAPNTIMPTANVKQQINEIPILSRVWCWITGGHWDDGSGNNGNYGAYGEVSKPGCRYEGDSNGDDGSGTFTYITIYLDDSGEVYYDPYSSGGGGGAQWGPPPCPGDGGSNNNSVKKQINSVNKKQINVADPGNGSGCPTAPDGSAWTPFSLAKYNLTSAQQAWLYDNLGYFEGLADFINDNPDMTDQDAADFLNTSINYLMANVSVSVPAFQNLIAPIINAVPVIDNNSPVIDPQKYINCFTDGKTASSYTMTIYVNQPTPGTNAQWSQNLVGTIGPGIPYIQPGGKLLDVGHTFVGFTKNNTDGTSITQVMGFYPGGTGYQSKGVIKNDGGHPYNVSYSSNVNLTEFNAALSSLVDDNNTGHYTLSAAQLPHVEYNCTDAGLAWMHAANITLPVAPMRGAFINTPGDFGQTLSTYSGASTTSSAAPQSHGPCN